MGVSFRRPFQRRTKDSEKKAFLVALPVHTYGIQGSSFLNLVGIVSAVDEREATRTFILSQYRGLYPQYNIAQSYATQVFDTLNQYTMGAKEYAEPIEEDDDSTSREIRLCDFLGWVYNDNKPHEDRKPQQYLETVKDLLRAHEEGKLLLYNRPLEQSPFDNMHKKYYIYEESDDFKQGCDLGDGWQVVQVITH